jgi:hypothetical protein
MEIRTTARFALAALLAAGLSSSYAADEGNTLKLKPKSALLQPHANAPFVAMPTDPVPDLTPRPIDSRETPRAACNDGSRSLCYDQSSGRLVYKPTREFMPDIPGLQREHISVKRDRITFRYSF